MAGLWYPPLGIAAAIGLTLYAVSAVGAHVRKGDFKSLPNPSAILILVAATLVLRVISV